MVKNMQRCVYAIPSSTIFPREAIEDLKKKHAESGGDSSPSFRAALQVCISFIPSFHDILRCCLGVIFCEIPAEVAMFKVCMNWTRDFFT